MARTEVSPPVADLLAQSREAPDRLAVVAEDGVGWTCARLDERSGRLAAGLAARGVVPGDRVALHLHGTVDAMVAYLGCLRAGAIAVPLNTRLSHGELGDLVERTRPVVYLGQRELYSRFAPIAQQLVPNAARFVNRPVPESPAADAQTLFSTPHDAVAAPAVCDPDHAALLLPTSGTTGRSKIVIWSHRTLSSLHLSAAGRGIESGSVLPILTPLMHGAAVYHLFNALSQRATAVLVPQFDAEAVLDAFARHRVTSVFGLPFMYSQLVRAQRSRPRDVGALRTATVAGDVCPSRIEQEFQEVFSVRLRSYWAAAEDVGATVTDARVGPFMRLIPEAAVRVIRRDGSETVAGETGELLIRSPTTSPGYWLSADEHTSMPDGVFHSGDLVRELEPGLLEYMGRDKDLIVRGGSNISPPEVEETLRAHPQVADVAVAGVADDELGQRVGALLVVANTDAANTDPDNPAIDEIMAWASQRLAHYKLPERIRVVQAIPRNDLTKIDRAAAGKALMSTETRQVNLRRLEEREVLGQTDSTDDWGGNGT